VFFTGQDLYPIGATDRFRAVVPKLQAILDS